VNAKGNPGSQDRGRKATEPLAGWPGRRDLTDSEATVDKEDIGIVIALIGIVLAVMLFGFGVLITLLLTS
jgi:hypothetical protein